MDFKINDLTPISKTDAKPAAEKPISEDFQFTLKRLGDEGLSARLERLISDITVQGDKIARHMDIRDLRLYRSLISEFINEVITNSYKFKRENYLNRRGYHVVYQIVNVVNKELDELAQELLNDEKNHIAILEKTGDIQGLLLDILV